MEPFDYQLDHPGCAAFSIGLDGCERGVDLPPVFGAARSDAGPRSLFNVAVAA
jgi:hypothetical protein